MEFGRDPEVPRPKLWARSGRFYRPDGAATDYQLGRTAGLSAPAFYCERIRWFLRVLKMPKYPPDSPLLLRAYFRLSRLLCFTMLRSGVVVWVGKSEYSLFGGPAIFRPAPSTPALRGFSILKNGAKKVQQSPESAKLKKNHAELRKKVGRPCGIP